MIALERTAYDKPIGEAQYGTITIGRPRQGVRTDKPSIAGEARDRGIPEGAVHRFLKQCPEHRGNPPEVILDLYEHYEASRPESITAAAARHKIEYTSLHRFKHKHGLIDLSPEELCQRYLEKRGCE